MEDQIFFTGSQHELILPSGKKVLVRESNGEDDAVLSKLKDATSGDGVIHYLANIVEKDLDADKKPLVSDIMEWLVSDKYYLLFKQRLINLGNDFKFSIPCINEDCPSQKNGEKAIDYEYDLTEFDGDLSNPDYKPATRYAVRRYSDNAREQTVDLSSGKKVKYRRLTTLLEKRKLDIPVEEMTKNTYINIRDPKIYKNSDWLIIGSWREFSSREMGVIREHVNTNDPLFDPKLKFKCPTCKMPHEIPLFNVSAFFWPEEMI